jgi:energy-coupling factor transport system permease protein
VSKLAAAVEYVHGNSPVHQLNAMSKIFWSLFVLAVGLLFNDYRYLLALLVSVLFVAAIGGVIKNFLPACTGLSVFALILLIIQALFYDQGQVLFHLIPGTRFLPVTDQGFLTGLAMAARMLALVLSFMIFLATTRTQDIILTLVEKFKLPYDYAFTFLTALRFIPTFFGEVRQVSEAQQARGYAVEGFNPLKKIMAYAPVGVPLVLLSLNKAENLAMAMETRGYGGGRRTYLRDPHLEVTDYCLIGMMVLLLAVSVVARIKGFGVM